MRKDELIGKNVQEDGWDSWIIFIAFSVFSFLILLARQVLSLTKLNRFDVQNTSLAFVPNLQVNVNKVSDAFKQNFNTF